MHRSDRNQLENCRSDLVATRFKIGVFLRAYTSDAKILELWGYRRSLGLSSGQVSPSPIQVVYGFIKHIDGVVKIS